MRLPPLEHRLGRTLGTRMTSEERAALDTMAAGELMTVTGMTRLIIRKAIADWDPEVRSDWRPI